MSVEDRLIRYCKVETQSNPKSKTSPSAKNVFNLAKVLVKELQAVGCKDASVDKYGYIYAHLPARHSSKKTTVGFVAHMDTAPDYTGENVNPRIIKRYNGKDILLKKGLWMKVKDYPQLSRYKGDDLMVTDGNTLLGADDKAGIAAIMEALKKLQSNSKIAHGPIAIAFTPDEEIGRGTAHFDPKKFGAKFAYTIDGDEVWVVNDETFHAASGVVSIKGVTMHTGDAKGKLINASNVAMEFDALLPSMMRPEYTENREGFFHITEMKGTNDQATLEYIIRNHDRKKFQAMKTMMKDAATFLNKKYGKKLVSVKIEDTYRNMHDVMVKYPKVTQIAYHAIEAIGYTPENHIIRGGTDGAELSFRGIPCPNLGAGGGNFHGRYEYCNITQLRKAVDLVVAITQQVLKEG